MSIYLSDLDYGAEIPNKVCPECGGSVAQSPAGPVCDMDGPVKPIADNVTILED